jgi:hypothetical protein
MMRQLDTLANQIIMQAGRLGSYTWRGCFGLVSFDKAGNQAERDERRYGTQDGAITSTVELNENVFHRHEWGLTLIMYAF